MMRTACRRTGNMTVCRLRTCCGLLVRFVLLCVWGCSCIPAPGTQVPTISSTIAASPGVAPSPSAAASPGVAPSPSPSAAQCPRLSDGSVGMPAPLATAGNPPPPPVTYQAEARFQVTVPPPAAARWIVCVYRTLTLAETGTHVKSDSDQTFMPKEPIVRFEVVDVAARAVLTKFDPAISIRAE